MPRAVPPFNRNGTSEPNLAPSVISSSVVSRKSQNLLSPNNIAAASALPPPRPAAAGTRFSKWMAAPALHPV